MIQGEGKRSEEFPRTLFVVRKRAWLFIRTASLTAAAKKGFKENKNHVPTVTILLRMGEE